ncbi:endonuclease/exonuclease/phosphatase [Streptomyces chrestomyceticus]|uniref:endonuclease/exonuclease/phosphatase n=1 Tax=Streptomyces chrestomyceticus TaxID=68185 RepID=UPI0036BB4F0A
MLSAPLRAATYNLLDGGGDRLEGQLGMLEDLALDLLCLQEATGWDDNGFDLMLHAASRLGMRAEFAPSRAGFPLVTLYRPSRLKLVGYNADLSRGTFFHAAALLTFTSDSFETIEVAHAHLDHSCPQARMREVARLTPYAEKGWGRGRLSHRYALCLGDMGMTGIGDDQHARIWSIIPPHRHARFRLMREDGTYAGMDERAMAALLHAGFVDPPARLGMKAPRTAGYWIKQQTGRCEETDHRTDHILLSPDLAGALETCTVIDNETTQQLSKHLPVVVTLDPARLR